MAASDVQDFFARHGPISDPGMYAAHYAELPRDLDQLCGVVNGLLVHSLWINLGQLPVAEARRAEPGIRTMEARLAWILARDPRPLTEPRPFPERLLGTCRDQALMLCSFLRHQHIPARVRTGFQPTGGPKKLDHAVCQVWSDSDRRWRTVDVQMDSLARERGRLAHEAQQYLAALTPQDTPADAFIPAGQAWRAYRAGAEDPATYGIDGDLWGAWMIRHNLLRDLLALNRYELIPWDMIPGSLLSHDRGLLGDEQLAFLDHVAAVTLDTDANLAEVRRLYADHPALHVPDAWVAAP